MYILSLRYFKLELKIPPWEWDEYYPDDMYGHYFPEDITALVQIETAIRERNKEKNK